MAQQHNSNLHQKLEQPCSYVNLGLCLNWALAVTSPFNLSLAMTAAQKELNFNLVWNFYYFTCYSFPPSSLFKRPSLVTRLSAVIFGAAPKLEQKLFFSKGQNFLCNY